MDVVIQAQRWPPMSSQCLARHSKELRDVQITPVSGWINVVRSSELSFCELRMACLKTAAGRIKEIIKMSG